MTNTQFYYITALLFIGFSAFGQRKTIQGQLISSGDVEGLHILNKTALKYDISSANGTFLIPAKVSDTLVVSGIKYKVETLIITNTMMQNGSLEIQLTENVNQLDEVILGKLLTGSLQSDLENSDAKTEVNFYDLGIPGYVGKPLTQNERKLHDADAGPMGSIGLGASVNFHKLLNKISGRTKKLKTIVALDDKTECINRLRNNYESIIFENNTLAEHLKNEYFFFCDEDPDFKAICDAKNDIKAIEFLQEKLIIYKQKLSINSKD